MRALAFVLRSAGASSIALAVLGVLAALCNGGLIAVVHRALSATAGSRHELALLFVGCALGKALTAYASGRVADSYSQRSVAALRRELIDKLLAVPYVRLERIGSARAYAALTSDVMLVNGALQASAAVLVNGAVLLGGAAYLAYLDLRAFLALIALAALGFALYTLLARRARSALRKARSENDRLLGHFRALTSGGKELRLHAARRRAFLDGPLLETTENLLAYELEGSSRYLFGQAINGLLVLGMIGVVLFAFGDADGLGSGVAAGYVLAGLYLTGPLASLLRSLPTFNSAEIALARVADIGIELGSKAREPSADPEARPRFTRIELREAGLSYEGERGFALGPVTLAVEPAQLLFITGGNGSGKSTLGKLLVGLYEPAQGQLLWDGRPVSGENRDSYRQLWSAVFSDFHLFDRFYGVPPDELAQHAQSWLDKLELAGAVELRGGVLSSLDLSSGQRKRLALLTALLEDRPIYLLDEWAADQDPGFKQVFYRELLPELKRRGKAVVVITHDDRYFDVADRVIELRDGRVRSDDRDPPQPVQSRRSS